MEQSLVVFLLYSASDARFADWLRQFLRPDEALPLRWLAKAYRPEEPELETPPAAVDGYDVLLHIVSQASNHAELQQMVATAGQEGRTVVLLRVDDVQLPAALADLPSVDFRRRWSDGLPQLRSRLEAVAASPRAGAQPGPVFLTNPPLLLPDDQFRDRTLEAANLTRQLFSDAIGVMVLEGPEGIGKTAMVARTLRSLGSGAPSWPQWVIYLPAEDSAPVSAPVLLEHLGRVTPSPGAPDFQPLLQDPDLTPADKLRELLPALGSVRVLVVIDNVEELLDEDGQFLDAELGEMLEILAGEVPHQVKALLLTCREPRRLLQGPPGSVKRRLLDDGLEKPEVREMLQTLDHNGTLGLRFADDALLDRIWALTGGNPRLLEALASVLERDRDTSLETLLSNLDRQRPEERPNYLLMRRLEGLGHTEQRLLQALAIYGRPVTAEAVDHLLEPYIRFYRSARELRRLLGWRLVRAERDGYYLPLADRERVLTGIARGRPEDRGATPPPDTQIALFYRAANYFEGARKEKEEVKGLDDLVPQLAEISLRLAGEEYDGALCLLHDVDLHHLRPWGYSQLLVPQRLRIIGHASERQAELANLDALGNALQQRDVEEAKRYLSGAVTLAQELGAPDDLARSYLNLGDAYLADLEPTWAAKRFEMALQEAEQHGLRTEALYAQASLSVCYGQMGRLDEAIGQQEQTLQAIAEASTADSSELEELANLHGQLLLSIGELLGRRGRPEEALGYLARGRELALSLSQGLLEGTMLSATAEIRLDLGETQRAIEAATEAIEVGRPRRNPQLLQQAFSMLALAQLYDEDLRSAKATVLNADRYLRHREKLEPSVLLGVVALRVGDQGRALYALNWVKHRAELRRKRDRHNVTLLDPHGLALCGLTLSGAGGYVAEAVAAFLEARRADGQQAGVARRTLRLLDQLAKVDTAGVLAPVRDAAAAR